MSEWQMPQNLMSMWTSSGPSARRSMCSGASGALAEGAPTAWAVVVVGDASVLVSSVISLGSRLGAWIGAWETLSVPPSQGLPGSAGWRFRGGMHLTRHSDTETVSRPLAALLGLLTVFGPISMDLYLPVLPALTHDLRAATSTAQLTVTACLLGLALGQVIAGPLSDRFGRRRPLVVGVVAYIGVSLLCAVSPTVETLVAARFVQGLAGAVGIVIAQAAGRDLYSGGALLRYYGRLTVLS